MGIGSRTDVKDKIRQGLVMVNDNRIMSTGIKIDLDSDVVKYDNQVVTYAMHEYYMLNKPSGVISATKDHKDKTVLELIDSKRKDLFPVGRLDKDTEGLLLITNDGELAHNLLSPIKHVPKRYFAKIEGNVTNEHVKAMALGMTFKDGTVVRPGELTILQSGDISEIELVIHEGMYHQVKRMFLNLGLKVVFLKRLSMGSLKLDTNLKPGEYRPLTDNEIQQLRGNTNVN